MTNYIINTRIKYRYNCILILAYIFDLSLAELYSIIFAELDGLYECDNILAATQLNNKPNAAEDVLGNKVVLLFKLIMEIPGVKPVVILFDSKVSYCLIRTVGKVPILLYKYLNAGS